MTFDDGGTLSGFFSIDTIDPVNLFDYDISTTAGTKINTPFHYTPLNSTFACTSIVPIGPAQAFESCAAYAGTASVQQLSFSFAAPFDPFSSGSVPLTTGANGGHEDLLGVSTVTRKFSGGVVTTELIPEPSAVAFLAVGAGLLLLFYFVGHKEKERYFLLDRTVSPGVSRGEVRLLL